MTVAGSMTFASAAPRRLAASTQRSGRVRPPRFMTPEFVGQALAPATGPCVCCQEATCPSFDYDLDINGDGWIDGEDLALVGGNYFYQCWDSATRSWSADACRTHPSELSPEIE